MKEYREDFEIDGICNIRDTRFDWGESSLITLPGNGRIKLLETLINGELWTDVIKLGSFLCS